MRYATPIGLISSSIFRDANEVDGSGHRLLMWFGNGLGAGTNVYEGCCVFQSMLVGSE